MYVIPLSLLATFIILVVASISFAYYFRQRPWKIHIPVQIVLLVLTWPISQLTFNVIYLYETNTIEAESVSSLGGNKNIPNECKSITYHTEPTGRWFYCNIIESDAQKWLDRNNFKSYEYFDCGVFGKEEKDIYKMLNSKNLLFYSTDPEDTGAAAIVALASNSMFLCQWYW